jgi:hypothetical protein
MPKKANNNKEENKKNLLKALEKTLGNISQACKMTGLSRMTYNNYKNEDEEFANAVKEINESAIDFVESKLFENIEMNRETSIIFFLKTRGKQRGYIETKETVIESKNIPIMQFDPLADIEEDETDESTD